MRDWTFQKAFSRMFVYNILFEDSEVDGRHLQLDTASRVLSISAAGCGVAGMLRFHPRSADAVDINHHHLALAALKMGAAQHGRSYSSFYDLFGRGWLPEPKREVRRITATLPDWVGSYWKQHYHRFNRTLYHRGLTARMLGGLRRLTGVDADWLRSIATLDSDGRVQAMVGRFGPYLDLPLLRQALDSPLQLMALGVNFEQRDRMLAADGVEDLVGFFVNYMARVAETDLSTNWFAWYAIAGHYDHERQDAVPPFLRRDSYEASVEAPTQTRYVHASIFDVLEAAPARRWTHYTLCDAIDWMPFGVQRRLLREIARTADDGAIVLWRSVEDDDIVQRHGLGDRFVRMHEASNAATTADRTRQYKRVDFYRVCA